MTTQTPQSFSTSGPADDPTLTGSESGASVRERAGQVGDTAKDEAAGVAQEVRDQTRDLVGEARHQVRQQVDTQKGRVSDLLREIGEEFDQMADRSDRNGIASELARQGAQRARDARSYLDGGGDVVEDIRRFARRRPGTFLLGAVAAGVLAGRATRAAAAARNRQQSGGQDARSFAGTGSPGYPGEYVTYPAGTAPTTGAFAQPTGYPDQTGGYPTGATTGTPSASPASGYAAAPTETTYETTATGAGYETPAAATEYTDQGYTPPAESLPTDREER